MKKSLFISLSVMILLTIIVGYTAYNIASRWEDMSDVITKSVARNMLLEEVSNNINRQVELVDLYTQSPSSAIKDEVTKLNKRILENINSLKYLSNEEYGDSSNIRYINVSYKYNIYKPAIDLLNNKDISPDAKVESLEKLMRSSFTINDRINNIQFPEYKDNIDELKRYSKNVTAWITLICGFLGFILMYISINHITKLYEQIEIQAKREKIVRELTSAVCSTFDLKAIFTLATREIIKNLGVDRCLILEVDDNNALAIVSESINHKLKTFNSNMYSGDILHNTNSLFLSSARSRNTIVISDLMSEDIDEKLLNAYKKWGVFSLVIVPILLQEDELYGFIKLECFESKRNWTLENIEMIKNLSNQLSIAISNAKLFERTIEKTEEVSELAGELEKNLNEIKIINKELVESNELNVKIQEDERLRIAQDLHDEVIQGLIGLVRKTDSINNDNKTNIQSEIRIMISQIRRICQNLRPSILNDLGFQSAIEWLMDDLEKYGVVPHIELDDNIDVKLPEKTELVIFRIIQELTNNVKKHSQAANTWLEMKYNNQNVIINFKDDGCGFDFNSVNQSKTLGLVGINERIKSVYGFFTIDSEIDVGTKAFISIPLNSNDGVN